MFDAFRGDVAASSSARKAERTPFCFELNGKSIEVRDRLLIHFGVSKIYDPKMIVNTGSVEIKFSETTIPSIFISEIISYPSPLLSSRQKVK